MAQEKEKEKGLNITLDDRTKKKVYPKIKEKLASLLEGDGGDNNLLEYIMLLISNNRAKSHIATDLEAFFGKEAKPFTNWLWDLLLPFASSSPVPTAPAPTEPKESEGKRKIDRDRLKRQSVKRKSEKEEPEPKSVSRSQDERPKDSEKSTDESGVSKESDKPKAEGVPRIFASAVKKSAESTTKQKRRVKKVRTAGDRKVQVKKRKVVKLSTNSIKEDQRAELRRARFTVTLNQPDLNSNQESIQSSIEDPPIRALPSSKSSKRARIVRIAQPSSSASTSPLPLSPPLTSQSTVSLPLKTQTSTSPVSEAPGTPTGVKNGPENTGTASTTTSTTTTTTSTSTVRCSFWPACSKGDECPFHHPKETCKFFPNCTFGDSCLNIHPQIPCKFGINCANPSCSFTHPPAVSGRGRGRGRGTRGRGRGRGTRGRGRGTNSRGRGRGGRGGGSSPGGPPCRFGAKCTRPGCTFVHPSKNLTLISASDAPCHFDPHCTTINCPFTHPKRGAQERDFLQGPATLTKPSTETNGVTTVPVAS